MPTIDILGEIIPPAVPGKAVRQEWADWQPIETAPRGLHDEVLTYRGPGLIAVAVWWANGWVVVDGCGIVGVTHWMPLPPSPKENEK